MRFKSTASIVPGDTGESAGDSRRPQRAEPSRSQPAGGTSAQPSAPAAPDPLKDGVNILRGIFGR